MGAQQVSEWTRTDDPKSSVPWALTEVERWVEEAMRNVSLDEVDPGVWVAAARACPGAWFDAGSAADAKDGLRRVLIDWAILKVRDFDGDVPVLGGIDLNGVDMSAL